MGKEHKLMSFHKNNHLLKSRKTTYTKKNKKQMELNFFKIKKIN
jgi:hypothetical protein